MKHKNFDYVLTNGKLFLPWNLFLSYLIITLVINIFGPWEYVGYDQTNKLMVFLYILVFICICTFTYAIGIYSKSQKKRFLIESKLDNQELKFLKTSLSISIIIYLLVIIEGVSNYGISLDDLSNLQENIALTYLRSQSSANLIRSIPLTFYIIGYYFCMVSMVLGLYRFRELDFKSKTSVILIYLLAFFYNALIIGSNKGFGDIVIMVLSVGLLKFSRRKSKLKPIVVMVLFFGLLSILILFANSFSNRVFLWGNVNNLLSGMAVLDTNNLLLRYLPGNLPIGVGLVLYYISHGYYGLSLSLKLPFVWTKGLGSSFALKDLANNFIDADRVATGLTYPERMEAVTSWKAFSNWHTIFPWLASDFTFFGAILVIAIFTYIYAVSWKEALVEENWLSILMFSFLNQVFLYIPANNQVFQTSTMLIAFMITFISWNYAHRKISNRIQKKT